jgi:Rrf2 family protein
MLSNKAKYGLKAMMHLASFEGPCLAADIARQNQIPRKFLDAILLELTKAGILTSKKGKGGGYHLARPANRITAGQVIRILDGSPPAAVDLQSAPNILARVLRLALRYRLRFTLATVSSLGATFFNLAIPRLLGVSIDRAHSLLSAGPADEAAALAALTLPGGMLVAAASLRGLLQMIAGFQSEFIGQSVGRDLRLAFFEKLQRVGFDFHDRNHSGDLITRGMLDLEGVRGVPGRRSRSAFRC